MGELGVAASVHFDPPLHLQPCFADAGLGPVPLPVTERLARTVATLPMHQDLAATELDAVADGGRGRGRARAAADSLARRLARPAVHEAGDHADIALVGGGVSCVAVLEPLVAGLLAGPARPRPARVLVLDAAGDFGGGVPYGRKVPAGCLCNDPAGRQHDAAFAAWLGERHDAWTDALRGSGDPGARLWLGLNTGALAAARSDPAGYAGLFVPRVVYGDFVRERLDRLLGAARATPRAVEVSFGRARVTGVGRVGGGFRLELGGEETATADAVVLALGSPPPRPEPGLGAEEGYVPAPSNVALAGLEARLARSLGAGGEVAILGGNAAALEVLAFLAVRPALFSRVSRVTLVTRGGLPDAVPSGLTGAPALSGLAALEGAAAGPSADALFLAARADAVEARAAGLTALDYAGPLHTRFATLVARLSPGERRRFVEAHGRAFKGLARHTPPEYRRAAESLAARGLLRVARATVRAVRRAKGGTGGLQVLARDARDGELSFIAAAVLDCRGWGYLDEAADPLLTGLLAPGSGLARANGSRVGLAVDEDLQASPGLFVLGPLLAGCCNARHAIWNTENARRIFALGPEIAGPLLRRLAALTAGGATPPSA
jgi:uncharacterized NAD(P)/FAD-binding protein YdhS